MSLRHILLGMLDRERSGYELKQEFADSLRHFWSAPLSQIYPTLHALAREGMARCTERPSPKGPPRKLYRRTRAGERELERWLREAPDVPDVRIPYLAKLYFLGQLGDPHATEKLLLALRASFEQRQGELQRAEQEIEGIDEDGMTLEVLHQYMSLRLGVLRLRSNVQWCVESIRRVRRHRLARTGLDVLRPSNTGGDLP